ncbi:MAG: phosphoribosyl 1,2-cyclic phosphate phosphodiesterase [Flavobacteriales bacterium]|jgi:phosphoribosyl 1,2-cyclic phosphate phosphodiesterase
MKVTLLGTGTSQGVPVIACDCDVCTSDDSRDKRFRASILITKDHQNIVIDTGPDFRMQMLSNKVQSLDAVVFTHEHKDHLAGLDDIRAFNFKQRQKMNVYATAGVQEALQREFHYVFAPVRYPGVPEIKLNTIDLTPFTAGNIQFIPIQVMHHKLPVLAFRVDDFAYVTDANYIAPEEFEKLKGVKYLIINALRIESHMSHFNLEQALEIIALLNPQKAWLTHLSHLMGKHQDIEKLLPENVEIAFDGQEIDIP